MVLGTVNKMIYHVRRDHPGMVEQHWRQCSTCPSRFPDQSTLSKHAYVCQPMRICRFCQDKFLTFKALAEHVAKHHQDAIEVSNYLIMMTLSVL